MKTISFVVPCYNSADYMDHCIETLVACGDDVEVIVVNDGSTKDNTSQIAHDWQERHPDIVRAVDQENRGHGGTVNHGLELASGLYFTVVDSDDWLDGAAMAHVMAYLRTQLDAENPTDLVVANYVYDKTHEHKRKTMSYRNVFPTDREFTWDEIGRFMPSQYLLMHSALYRTCLLADMGLRLPEHCFYVDNVFVYAPLPQVKSLRYFDVDMYHYFIGREDQSVNERVMLSSIDQQIRITKTMIDLVDLTQVEQGKLANYMFNYLSMMMCICSVFLRMEETPENEAKRAEIWDYLRTTRPAMYAHVRASILNLGTNLPSPAGRSFGLGCYRIAQKLFKFN